MPSDAVPHDLRPSPRYRQILDDLRQAIAAGRHGARLPAEPILAAHYQVSRMTLRRALATLIEEGLLTARQGAGTFVTQSPSTPRIVGLLVPPMLNGGSDPYLRHLTHHLLIAGANCGWTLRLSPSVDHMAHRLAAGRGATMAGCVAVAFGRDHVDDLRALSVPLILVDSEPLPGVPSILPDNRGGIRSVVARLALLGHRHIVHLAGPASTPSGRERRAAFRIALEELDLPMLDHGVVEGSYQLQDGHRAMTLWWQRMPRPTAVVCANDRMAHGVLQWAQATGVAVPGELSVVGFDGLDAGETAWPPLTTLAVDFASHARSVVDAIDGVRSNHRTPVLLTERGSMGPAPRIYQGTT